jgi:uncharacterized membrane protein
VKLLVAKVVARGILAIALIFAGVAHLTYARVEFQAQVPIWLPVDPDFVVVASGVVEVILGALLLTWGKVAKLAGLATAMFFIAIFAGNVNQFVEGIDAFGLNTDEARFVRLFFQPVLVAWALWSTGAWSLVRLWLSRWRET